MNQAMNNAPEPKAKRSPRVGLGFACWSLPAFLVLQACAVGPDYQRPALAVPPAYKEVQALPKSSPAPEHGQWWLVFGDAQLNALEAQVNLSNQSIAAAQAAYEQAQAAVNGQRAAFFPQLALDGSATRSGGQAGGGASNLGGSGGGGASSASDNYKASVNATWVPDVWGRLRRASEAAGANAEASEADLAGARLSMQGALATNYFSLRQADVQKICLFETVVAYQRALQITQNRYAAGIAAQTDVLQAQTQLANAQASALAVVQQRAQYEHAIAVLIGKAPANFSLAAAPSWQPKVPRVPAGLPSTLLQRRPDIVAAERRVAAANAQIGVAKSAYFPNISLSAAAGSGAAVAADLFKASSTLWSVGISAAQTLFDAGATSAQVASARAGHEQAEAQYKQTVLAAFANVEDALAATHSLTQQTLWRQQAALAADQAQTRMMNQYRAGLVDYTQVASTQVAALSARQALTQALSAQQSTAVALIQALGGAW